MKCRRPVPTQRLAVAVALTLIVAGCANDDDDPPIAFDTPTTLASDSTTTSPTNTTPATSPTTSPTTTSPTTTDPAPSAPPTTAEYTTTTTEPRPPVPEGILVAIPTQNREDPAKNQFQVQVRNGTRDRFDISGVQFEWDGFATEASDAYTGVIVGGQTLDLPVPFPGAMCAGDGTRATMPSLDLAQVRMLLQDGSEVVMPVVDKWFLARKLYEDDCEKQLIESLVTIEWADLHEGEFEGRPVTVGELRLTRRDGAGEFTVLEVSPTVPFSFDAINTEPGEPVAVLADDQPSVSVPIQFIESRCDPHALAEIKQPTMFVAQIQFPDGTIRPYIIYPARDLWTPMRLTADKACVALGKVEFVGEE